MQYQFCEIFKKLLELTIRKGNRIEILEPEELPFPGYNQKFVDADQKIYKAKKEYYQMGIWVEILNIILNL